MITICMAYYDNAEMLARHIREWEHYSDQAKELLKVIIVDDGSPTTSAERVLRSQGKAEMSLKLFRIKPDIPWNQDGARNLAMMECATPWALLTDMDHLLPRAEAEQLVQRSFKPGTYYLPDQLLTSGISLRRPHPNTYIMNRADFWAMGGYDEDFAGFYGSDGNFRKCAKGAGLIEQFLLEQHLVVYRAEDIFDANTKRYGRKGSEYHAMFNPKLDAKRRGPAYKAVRPIRFEFHRVF
jgi:hypothetical protein